MRGPKKFNEMLGIVGDTVSANLMMYRLGDLPLAFQVWFYKCCFMVDKNLISRVGNSVPRIFNWQLRKYPSFMDLTSRITVISIYQFYQSANDDKNYDHDGYQHFNDHDFVVGTANDVVNDEKDWIEYGLTDEDIAKINMSQIKERYRSFGCRCAYIQGWYIYVYDSNHDALNDVLVMQDLLLHAFMIPHFLISIGFYGNRNDIDSNSDAYVNKALFDTLDVNLVSKLPHLTNTDCDAFVATFT
ncbi:hypothetical protein HAX54_005335 [Datura stramonium]|uniref:Uncharacterized protein n=1 Tax=Datura stramonium TaxID=4076 RepID=A0ABS8WYC6_DATST|nr:hypothetical protein [Datura stramonium]